jgi:aldehyde dehydrogenase (NAD+)
MKHAGDLPDIDLPNGHWIGGSYVDDAGVIDISRPSDGVDYYRSPVADDELVDRAVTTAKSALAQSGWSRCRPRERANALQRWADLIRKEAHTIGMLEAIGSTRPVSQAVAIDVEVTAEQIRFFAEFADKQGGDVVPTDGDHVGMIIDEPYGVIGAITPWNVPVSMAGWKLGPALAAGNAVVLKPSEITPFSTLYLAELASKAGIPDGLINIVLGDGATTGTALVSHPDVAKISFTGSTVAGGAILERIGRTSVKPVTLELGGKSPQLVFASADIERAADSIAHGILFNAGQTCVAGSRVVVEEKVAPRLVALLRDRMSVFRAGPTWNAGTDFSPIVSERQIARIDAMVTATDAMGASLVLGGHRLDRQGYYYAPTILADVAASSEILEEEVFGPVLTIETFRDEEEGLAIAGHRKYGLAAGVYTSELSQALRAVKTLESGTVWVNRYGRSRDHILPTGGYKSSGIGKDLGREAYDSCRRYKSVLIRL